MDDKAAWDRPHAIAERVETERPSGCARKYNLTESVFFFFCLLGRTSVEIARLDMRKATS